MTDQTMGLESCQGCLLGLALGDALGAPHEGGPIERLVWGVIGRTRRWERRWTDDTQMSLDLAESLVANGGVDQGDLARRFARSYRWSRGYGAGTRRVLRAIARGTDWPAASRVGHPEGSYGNGAAMRAPAVALFFGADRAHAASGRRTRPRSGLEECSRRALVRVDTRRLVGLAPRAETRRVDPAASCVRRPRVAHEPEAPRRRLDPADQTQRDFCGRPSAMS